MRRGEPVPADDGDIGKIQGLVVVMSSVIPFSSTPETPPIAMATRLQPQK